MTCHKRKACYNQRILLLLEPAHRVRRVCFGGRTALLNFRRLCRTSPKWRRLYRAEFHHERERATLFLLYWIELIQSSIICLVPQRPNGRWWAGPRGRQTFNYASGACCRHDTISLESSFVLTRQKAMHQCLIKLVALLQSRREVKQVVNPGKERDFLGPSGETWTQWRSKISHYLTVP